MPRNTLILALLGCLLLSAGAIAASEDAKMVFIQNKQIRVGINLAIGGAITHVSTVDGPNLINSCDWGRQIQQSYYSGPPNYTREGKEKSKNWAEFCWNPIQSGDAFGNGAQVLAYRKKGNTLYVKTRPKLWPMRDDAGECTFETWITLDGATFTWHARLTNARGDTTWYGAYGQELPAIYTNGPWHRLISYTGDQPYAGGQTVEIRNDHGEPWPWVNFLATEGWAALLNEHGDGLGVWHPTVTQFNGGFACGKRGEGGPKDPPTGYMAPTRSEHLDYNIVYDYQCVFIVGSQQAIRDFACAHAPTAPPSWSFTRNRAGWTYQNARDDGWPIRHGVTLHALHEGEIRLNSPFCVWRAAQAPRLALRARLPKGEEKTITIYWRGMPVKPAMSGSEWGNWCGQWWAPERSIELPITGDGKEQWYVAELSAKPTYTGTLTGLSIVLPGMNPATGVGLREIRLLKPGATAP